MPKKRSERIVEEKYNSSKYIEEQKTKEDLKKWLPQVEEII